MIACKTVGLAQARFKRLVEPGERIVQLSRERVADSRKRTVAGLPGPDAQRMWCAARLRTDVPAALTAIRTAVDQEIVDAVLDVGDSNWASRRCFRSSVSSP